MRIAEFRESSDLWTQVAPEGYPSGMSVSVSERFHNNLNVIEFGLLDDSNIIILLFSLMKDARGDLSVQWSGHITRMWFHWKHRIIIFNSRYHNYNLFYEVLFGLNLINKLSIPCIWDRQDHPLNLSISLSGGKEINEDCLSSGERSGKSPSLKSEAFRLRIVI